MPTKFQVHFVLLQDIGHGASLSIDRFHHPAEFLGESQTDSGSEDHDFRDLAGRHGQCLRADLSFRGALAGRRVLNDRLLEAPV